VGTVILLIENSGPHFPSERRRNELSLNQQAQTTPLQLQSRHGDKSMQPGILHISLFMSPAPVFTLSPPPTLTHLRTTISKQIENLNKKHKDKQQLSIHWQACPVHWPPGTQRARDLEELTRRKQRDGKFHRRQTPFVRLRRQLWPALPKAENWERNRRMESDKWVAEPKGSVRGEEVGEEPRSKVRVRATRSCSRSTSSLKQPKYFPCERHTLATSSVHPRTFTSKSSDTF